MYWLTGTGASSARLYWESIAQVIRWFTTATGDASPSRPGAACSPRRCRGPPGAGPGAASPTSCTGANRAAAVTSPPGNSRGCSPAKSAQSPAVAPVHLDSPEPVSRRGCPGGRVLPGGGVHWQLPLPGQAFYPVPVETFTFCSPTLTARGRCCGRWGRRLRAGAGRASRADVHVRGEAVEQGLEAAFELAGQGGFCHRGPGVLRPGRFPRRSRLAEGSPRPGPGDAVRDRGGDHGRVFLG